MGFSHDFPMEIIRFSHDVNVFQNGARLHPAAAAAAPPRSSPPRPCRARGRAERGRDPGRNPTWGTVNGEGCLEDPSFSITVIHPIMHV